MRHLRYEYDLISGNVKMVRYQNGDDGMRHRYTYDADNRITEVETSADGQVWYRDAEYFYYPHGPLRRVELGQHKVQGMDYAYTLQGWLKGINSDLLEPKNDMGQDGVAGTANFSVGRDAYGMSIGYYGDDDYSAIDDARWDNQYGTKPFAAVGGAGTLAAAHNPLFNGNIAHTVNSLQPWGGWTAPSQPAQVLAQVYRYDQLNRLKQAQGVEGLTVATNSWDGVTDAVADRYKSAYTYDANGNILTAERHDETGQQYDDFAYQYHDPGGLLAQNRLYDLYDAATHTTGADIVAPAGTFDNSTTGVNQNNNYKYDELGNLIADTREEIGSIHWTVAGKVKRIARTAGSSKPSLVFAYGADGQRISKQVGEPTSGGHKEYYIRDASGNIMATYRYLLNPVPNTNPPEYESSLKLTERPIYGSSRIGSHTRQMEMVGSTPPQYYPYIQPMHAPLKRYELTDHLGNVATVVTGKLLPGNGAGSAYQADVVSAQGYEAFGSLMPGRNFSSGSYDYGFGGKRKDDEIHGATGTSYDFGERMYDPRIARFFSMDPVNPSMRTPYSYAANNPIAFIDVDGEWPCWSCWAQKALPVVSMALDFVPVVGQVKGWAEGAIGYTLDGEKLEPWERALAFVPGGKIARAVTKVGAAVVTVVKAEHIVEKVQKVTKRVHVRIKTPDVHGNSAKSTKPQHVYEIVDNETGEVYKYGVSGSPLNANNTSRRANSQVNKLNKDGGNYSANIIESGVNNRRSALDLERKMVDDFARSHGGQAPRGNIRPKPRTRKHTPKITF